MPTKPKNRDFVHVLAIILVVAGTICLIASLALTYDKLKVLNNPSYRPSCNINPVLSCGSVMKTKQADLLGLPNTIYGLIGYTAITTFGALLLSGARFKRWVWLSLQLGVSVAFIFVHYLFFEGIFRIHAICPFCFVTWMATAPMFWYTTVYNIQANNIKFRERLTKVRGFILRRHGDIMISWYVIIIGILLKQFWYYWKTLI